MPDFKKTKNKQTKKPKKQQKAKPEMIVWRFRLLKSHTNSDNSNDAITINDFFGHENVQESRRSSLFLELSEHPAYLRLDIGNSSLEEC